MSEVEPDRVMGDATTMGELVDWHAQDRPCCRERSLLLGRDGLLCPRCRWWAA